MKPLILTTIILLFAQYSNAQWVEQGLGFPNTGGLVNSVSVPEQGVIWLGIKSNSQLKTGLSTDDGLTWSFFEIDNTIPDYSVVNIKGISADTAYASLCRLPQQDSSRIYRTVNGGQSWDLIPTAFSGQDEVCLSFHFFDANEGVAFGGPHWSQVSVYRTLDGGDTWAKVPASNLPTPLTDEGMMYYWTSGGYGAAGDHIWFGTTKGRIYKSTDRGASWTASMVDASRAICSVDFRDENNGVAISMISASSGGASSNRVYTTADGGGTWIQPANVPPDPEMIVVNYIPGTANTYVTTYGSGPSGIGTQISTDGGATWNVHDLERICGVDFLNENYGWGGGPTFASSVGIQRWSGVSSIEELASSEKELVKIVDLLGRETQFTSNTPLIFIYSDGSTERVMELEY